MHTTVQTCAHLCRLVHRCVHKSAQLRHRVGGAGAEGQRACTAVCTTLHILCSGSAATGRWGCGCTHTGADLCTAVHICAEVCTALQTCAQLCAQLCTPRAAVRRPRVEGSGGWICPQLCRLVHSSVDLCTAVRTRAQLCRIVHGPADLCTTLPNLCNISTTAGRRSCAYAHNCADLCTAVQTCAPLCVQVCTTT